MDHEGLLNPGTELDCQLVASVNSPDGHPITRMCRIRRSGR